MKTRNNKKAGAAISEVMKTIIWLAILIGAGIAITFIINNAIK